VTYELAHRVLRKDLANVGENQDLTRRDFAHLVQRSRLTFAVRRSNEDDSAIGEALDLFVTPVGRPVRVDDDLNLVRG